jgi:hypothetical protein
LSKEDIGCYREVCVEVISKYFSSSQNC